MAAVARKIIAAVVPAEDKKQELDRRELADALPKPAFGRPGLLLPPGSEIEVDINGAACVGLVLPYDERWCRGDFPVRVGELTHMLTYPRANIRVYYVPRFNVLPLR